MSGSAPCVNTNAEPDQNERGTFAMASRSLPQYVSVRLSHSSPAMIVEERGSQVLVRFAAGNVRLVHPDQLEPATPAEIQEYRDMVSHRERVELAFALAVLPQLEKPLNRFVDRVLDLCGVQG